MYHNFCLFIIVSFFTSFIFSSSDSLPATHIYWGIEIENIAIADQETTLLSLLLNSCYHSIHAKEILLWGNLFRNLSSERQQIKITYTLHTPHQEKRNYFITVSDIPSLTAYFIKGIVHRRMQKILKKINSLPILSDTNNVPLYTKLLSVYLNPENNFLEEYIDQEYDQTEDKEIQMTPAEEKMFTVLEKLYLTPEWKNVKKSIYLNYCLKKMGKVYIASQLNTIKTCYGFYNGQIIVPLMMGSITGISYGTLPANNISTLSAYIAQ
jgi:hypothetical protein